MQYHYSLRHLETGDLFRRLGAEQSAPIVGAEQSAPITQQLTIDPDALPIEARPAVFRAHGREYVPVGEHEIAGREPSFDERWAMGLGISLPMMATRVMADLDAIDKAIEAQMRSDANSYAAGALALQDMGTFTAWADDSVDKPHYHDPAVLDHDEKYPRASGRHEGYRVTQRESKAAMARQNDLDSNADTRVKPIMVKMVRAISAEERKAADAERKRVARAAAFNPNNARSLGGRKAAGTRAQNAAAVRVQVQTALATMA